MSVTAIQFGLHKRQTKGNRPKMHRECLMVPAILILSLASGCAKQAAETSRGVDLGDAKGAAEKVAEGDKLYSEREDLAKARQAVALLRQARLEDYGSFEAAWKLARADYFLGEHTGDPHERDNAFREGEEAGKAAVRLQDGKPEGHFWLGANYGGRAKYSVLSGLSSIEDIQKEMDAVLKLDEGFQAGSAYMVLGQLYLEAPRMLGGDQQKAIRYLEKGLRFGSNNALLRLHLAKAYHAANRDSDARKEIDFIMAMKLEPEYQAEYKGALDQARKLLPQLKGS